MTFAALCEDPGDIPLILPSMMPSHYDMPSFSALLYVGTPGYKNVGSVDHVIPNAVGMHFIVIGLWPIGPPTNYVLVFETRNQNSTWMEILL